MSFFAEANYEFVGKRKVASLLSVALLVLGMGSLVARGGPSYSIDFTGGSLIQVQFSEVVSVDAVRLIQSITASLNRATRTPATRKRSRT